MIRSPLIMTLLLGLALAGCSAEKDKTNSLAPATVTASMSGAAPAAKRSGREFASDHIAQRPAWQSQSPPAKNADLPLWPPVSEPPKNAHATPPVKPALPAFDPPTTFPEPGDLNPLRSTAPSLPKASQPTTQIPALPGPVAPAPATAGPVPVPPPAWVNPLRGREAEGPAPVPPLPSLPLPSAAPETTAAVRWPAMNSMQTAPEPVGSGSPLAPTTSPDSQPFGEKPAESTPLLPHAPSDAQSESPPPTAPRAQLRPLAPPPPQAMVTQEMVKSTPPRLPRVSIYSAAKQPAVARSTQRSALAPPASDPGGGAAPEVRSGEPPMMSLGTRQPPELPVATLPLMEDGPQESVPPFPSASAPSSAFPSASAEPAFGPFRPESTSPEVAAQPDAATPALDDPATEPAEMEPGTPAAATPATSAPVSTIAIPEPAPNDPFDVVRVFYGTDRRTILVNEDSLLSRILRFLPAVILIALSVVGICVVLGTRQIRWAIGTVGLIVFSVLATWHGISETITIAEQAALEEPKYSSEKSDRGRIERGVCEVTIPKTHEPGELEGPSVFRFERKFDPERHITLRKTIRLQDQLFYEQLRQQVASSPDREILVFVHGFNVTFEDAARRTAQMAHDLKLQGAPVFFSWPADKYFLLTYGKDETSVGWSAPHLKEFLLDLVHHTDARAINLVAHSMGNRALATALREIDLQLQDESRMFNQVVLAAPDIDADDFRDNIAPAIQRTAKQVTLYASSNDVALSASRFFHRNARAGDTSQGLVLVPGVHTIDVSNIDGGPWGHSYYGASDPVLRDLHLLLTSLPPERRTWLKMSERDGQTYWAFKPLGTARGPAVVEPR